MSNQDDNVRRLVRFLAQQAAAESASMVAMLRQETDRAVADLISGSGTAGQIAYFDGLRSITSSAGLAWNNTLRQLTITTLTDNSAIVGTNSADNGTVFTGVATGIGGKALVVTATSSATVAIDAVGDVDIDGDLTITTPLGTASGGTGAATFTTNGVLLGNGTGAISVTAAGTANQVLRVPSGGGAPAFGAIDLGSAAAVGGTLADARLSTNVPLLNAANVFANVQRVNFSDANTTGAANVLILDRASTGTPAATFGSDVRIRLESSTTESRDAFLIRTDWQTATDASRRSRVRFFVYDASSSREVFAMESSGSAAALAWFGGTLTTKQTVTGSRGGNAALANLLTALSNYGLITDSSTA